MFKYKRRRKGILLCLFIVLVITGSKSIYDICEKNKKNTNAPIISKDVKIKRVYGDFNEIFKRGDYPKPPPPRDIDDKGLRKD